MTVYSIIQKSQLEGAKRLDAEYYQPEYLEIVQEIESVPHTSLDSYAEKVFSGPFGSTLKSESYQDTGVPFIRISDISDLFIEKHGVVFISPSEHKRIYSTHLGVGDIVLSKIGTVGRLSVISEELGEVNISENNIGIRLSKLPVEKKIALLFLLLSKYGQKQLLRKASGNIQLKLNVSDVESIQVPVFDEAMLQTLKNLYTDFLSKRNEGDSLYSQAEKVLLEELGLTDFESDGELWNVVNLSDVKAAGRIDAEYFQPKYERIVERIKSQKHATVDDVSAFVGHATQSPYDERGSIAVLAQKHMKRDLHIEVDGFDNFTTDDLIKKNDKKYILKKGDILISSAGEPGLTSVWTGELGQKVIPGSFVTVARLKEDINPLYLGVFLNTPAGKLQFERDYTGSVQQYVYPSKIAKIFVPILPEKAQQKIAELVRESHVARAKARELLESAKRKVEELIESKQK